MKITQLLYTERSKVKGSSKTKLKLFKKFPHKTEKNVIARTIQFYWLVMNESEVDLVLTCRVILRYFLIVLIVCCFFSKVTVNP